VFPFTYNNENRLFEFDSDTYRFRVQTRHDPLLGTPEKMWGPWYDWSDKTPEEHYFSRDYLEWLPDL
jgi:hypothetical protein